MEQRGKYGNAGSPASQATDNFRPDDNHRSEGSQGGNSGESGQTHINSPSVEASGAVERRRGKNIKAPALHHPSRRRATKADGDVRTHPVCGSNRARASARWNCLRQPHRSDDVDHSVFNPAVSLIIARHIYAGVRPAQLLRRLTHRALIA